MKIAVVGATGRTGREVVKLGLARGHDMTALARRPTALGIDHPRLTTLAADVFDADSLSKALLGADAVISAVGAGATRAPTRIYSQGAENIVTAMRTSGITRLAVVSAGPAGPRADQRFVERRLAMPLLERVFGATYRDMRLMEAFLLQSTVDWTSLRPPRLVAKPATGSYRIDTKRALSRAWSLAYPDLAAALLDVLPQSDLFRQTAYVAN